MPKPNNRQSTVIPVLEERVELNKKVVPQSVVSIQKVVDTTEKVVDLPFVSHGYEIRHVAVNREIEKPPKMRHEGETVVIPVVEEVVFVEKRLILREEIRLIPKRRETRRSRKFTLRRERAIVNRKNLANSNPEKSIKENKQL